MKEKEYLLKALNKSGYIIMVLRFDVNTGQSKMEYISPNAEPMGLNIRLLREGLKLIIFIQRIERVFWRLFKRQFMLR